MELCNSNEFKRTLSWERMFLTNYYFQGKCERTTGDLSDNEVGPKSIKNLRKVEGEGGGGSGGQN